MKKIIGAAVFGLILGFIIISNVTGGSNSKAKQTAITKVKMYEMQTNLSSLNETTKGMSLSVYLEKYVLQLIKAGRIVESGNWSAEENISKSGYIVKYAFKLGGEENFFQWEVIGDKIEAQNGKAKSATPELDITN